MKPKKYLIEEGNHRSGFYPNLHFNIKNIKYEVIFTESCLYKFNDVDDYDVNKLFGISFGYHHNNSIRFGWDIEDEEIAIYAYSYKSSKRDIKKIISIPINRKYIFEINVFDGYYDMKIFNSENNLIGWANIPKVKTTKLCYNLFPYFGGNKVAPHDIKIWMKQIS